MENLNEIKIAFDNAGGIVLVAPNYAHYYDDGRKVAEDVTNLIEGSNISIWDGNDENLLAEMTDEELGRFDPVYTAEEVSRLVDRRDPKVEVEEDGSVSVHDGRLNSHLGGHSEEQFFLGMMGVSA